MVTSLDPANGTDVQAMGRRIASYRKRVGIKTARELAERIGNPKITTTVIQNIESGRKLEPSVSQLLDIAKGIGISPVFLLAPVGKPFEKIDIPGVGSALANMTVTDFLSWVTLEDVPGESQYSTSLRATVNRLRRLLTDIEMEKRISQSPDLTAPDIEYEEEAPDGNTYPAIHSPSQNAQMSLDACRSDIDFSYNILKKTGLDVSWVERPWIENSE